MTGLEVLLIMILWVLYGIWSAKQEVEEGGVSNEDAVGVYIFSILFSPLVLIARIIKGIFTPFGNL